MKSNIRQRRQNVATFLLSLLSILFMTMGGCTEPDMLDHVGGSGRTSSLEKSVTATQLAQQTQILWTHRDGTQRSAPAPADGILVQKTLNVPCVEVKSVDFIPSSVTSIGENAFLGCRNLGSINIPNSVTSIGEYAFQKCTSLTSITIPNSVTEIGESAFSGCKNLTSVRVEAISPPKAIYYYSSWDAFENTASTLSITVPDASVAAYKEADGWKEYAGNIYGSRIAWTDIRGIKRQAPSPADGILVSSTLTSNKGEIKSVDDIPPSVTSIGENAFRYCSRLERITIPGSVTNIGRAAFEYCRSLTSITVSGNSLTSIGYDAFKDCTGLKEIAIPSSVTSIESGTFYGCTGLKEIAIPSSVKSIETATFYGCTGLEEIAIPSSVKSIGGSAFADCTGLKEIAIPNSVRSIGGSAFAGCTELKEVMIENGVTSIGGYAFYRCSGLERITIPSSVTSIGEEAFAYCTGLKDITIPSSVTSIGRYAFADCRGLGSVRVEAETPPIAEYYFAPWGAFVGTASSLEIRVPPASVTLYQNDDGWRDYANKIKGY